VAVAVSPEVVVVDVVAVVVDVVDVDVLVVAMVVGVVVVVVSEAESPPHDVAAAMRAAPSTISPVLLIGGPLFRCGSAIQAPTSGTTLPNAAPTTQGDESPTAAFAVTGAQAGRVAAVPSCRGEARR
jgi:hypothetical protein